MLEVPPAAVPNEGGNCHPEADSAGASNQKQPEPQVTEKLDVSLEPSCAAFPPRPEPNPIDTKRKRSEVVNKVRNWGALDSAERQETFDQLCDLILGQDSSALEAELKEAGLLPTFRKENGLKFKEWQRFPALVELLSSDVQIGIASELAASASSEKHDTLVRHLHYIDKSEELAKIQIHTERARGYLPWLAIATDEQEAKRYPPETRATIGRVLFGEFDPTRRDSLIQRLLSGEMRLLESAGLPAIVFSINGFVAHGSENMVTMGTCSIANLKGYLSLPPAILILVSLEGSSSLTTLRHEMAHARTTAFWNRSGRETTVERYGINELISIIDAEELDTADATIHILEDYMNNARAVCIRYVEATEELLVDWDDGLKTERNIVQSDPALSAEGYAKLIDNMKAFVRRVFATKDIINKDRLVFALRRQPSFASFPVIR